MSRAGTMLEDYWQVHGMHQDPFAQLTPPFFYSFTQWDSLREWLLHTTLYNNALAVIQGPRGSGKTTFMEQFYQQIGSEAACYQIDGDPELSSDELLQIITQAFSLPNLDAEITDILQQFEIQCQNIRRNGRHCVLMIDDAHCLPESTLNALLNIIKSQQNTSPYLHLILFAEPSLSHWTANLDWSALDDIVQTQEMPRLDAETAENYLQHRFRAAGLHADLPLSFEQIEAITHEADGLIAELNHLCKNHLRGEDQSRGGFNWLPNIKHPYWVTSFVGLMVIIVTALVYLPSGLQHKRRVTPLHYPVKVAMNDKSVLPKPRALKSVLQEVQPQRQPLLSPEPAAQTLTTNMVNAMQSPEPELVSVIQPIRASDLMDTVLTSHIHTVAHKHLHQKPTEPTEADKQRALDAAHKNYQRVAHQPVVDRVVAVPKTLHSTPKVNAKKVHHRRVKKRVKHTKKTVVKKSPRRVNKPRVSRTSGYGIQLMGTRDKAQARYFIKARRLYRHAHVYRTTMGGKPWYIVVYGQYKNRDQAHVALSRLPRALKKLHPWIRTRKALRPV